MFMDQCLRRSTTQFDCAACARQVTGPGKEHSHARARRANADSCPAGARHQRERFPKPTKTERRTGCPDASSQHGMTEREDRRGVGQDEVLASKIRHHAIAARVMMCGKRGPLQAHARGHRETRRLGREEGQSVSSSHERQLHGHCACCTLKEPMRTVRASRGNHLMERTQGVHNCQTSTSVWQFLGVPLEEEATINGSNGSSAIRLAAATTLARAHDLDCRHLSTYHEHQCSSQSRARQAAAVAAEKHKTWIVKGVIGSVEEELTEEGFAWCDGTGGHDPT